jgi:ankyrin repeat protein
VSLTPWFYTEVQILILTRYGTALTASAYDGTIRIVTALLECGADLHSSDGWPLQAAAAEGHADVVEFLLDRGADVNRHAEKFENGTAIMAACEAGNVQIVELLLKRGADPNLGGGDNKYPLIAATKKSEAKIVQMLLDAKATVDVFGSWQNTSAFILAAANMPRETLEIMLLAGAEIDLADPDGDTPLIIAAVAGDEECVQFLIDNGADILHANNIGHNALQAAHNNENDSCVEILIEEMSKYIAALSKAVDTGDKAAEAIVQNAGTKRKGGPKPISTAIIPPKEVEEDDSEDAVVPEEEVHTHVEDDDDKDEEDKINSETNNQSEVVAHTSTHITEGLAPGVQELVVNQEVVLTHYAQQDMSTLEKEPELTPLQAAASPEFTQPQTLTPESVAQNTEYTPGQDFIKRKPAPVAVQPEQYSTTTFQDAPIPVEHIQAVPAPAVGYPEARPVYQNHASFPGAPTPYQNMYPQPIAVQPAAVAPYQNVTPIQQQYLPSQNFAQTNPVQYGEPLQTQQQYQQQQQQQQQQSYQQVYQQTYQAYHAVQPVQAGTHPEQGQAYQQQQYGPPSQQQQYTQPQQQQYTPPPQQQQYTPPPQQQQSPPQAYVTQQDSTSAANSLKPQRSSFFGVGVKTGLDKFKQFTNK